MNIFQRIKEVKLPLFAVIGALVFGGIVAPANAVGTTLTSTDILRTTINRGTTTYNSNTTSTVATVGAGERATGAFGYANFATPQSPISLQAGDSIKINARYTNLTSSSTASSISIGYLSWSGNIQSSNSYYNGNASASVSGSNNSATRTEPLSTFVTGTYDSFYINVNLNFTDSAIATGDQVKAEFDFFLVRGGTETPLNPLSQQGGQTSIRITQLQQAAYTAISGDQFVYSYGSMCIYKDENGVTAGTQIEIRPVNNGTISSGYTDVMPMMGASLQPNNGVYTFTMPSSSAASQQIMVNFNSNSNLTSGQTWDPQFTAVIAGTSVNVIDRCNRSQQVTPPSQSSVTSGVQRPLPKISFATNPAPGFSVRPTSDTRKGTLTLQGENFSDLTAITIGGKKADFTVKDGKLEIKLPAGVTGFPEVVMTNGGGSITMQNAIEIVENKVQKLTRFVGDRFTKAGLEVLENALIEHKESTSIEAIVVVAADATEADYANAVKAATDAATYLDKVSKRIAHTSVTVVKTGTAGSKPVVEMNFTKQ